MIKEKNNVRILVLEELLPFPEESLKEKLSDISKNSKVLSIFLDHMGLRSAY